MDKGDPTEPKDKNEKIESSGVAESPPHQPITTNEQPPAAATEGEAAAAAGEAAPEAEKPAPTSGLAMPGAE